jgi:hypothetical protein
MNWVSVFTEERSATETPYPTGHFFDKGRGIEIRRREMGAWLINND